MHPRLRLFILSAAAVVSALAAAPADAGRKDIEKRMISSAGQERAFFFYRPRAATGENASLPLVILLHGSGRDGMSLADRWWKLADKQGFVIAAPNASDPRSWRTPQDGPDFLFDLVEQLAQQEGLDRRRVYLFGHSAGASFALQMALIESEYFAAVAVHAGRLAPDAHPLIDLAKRKTPMLIIIGTRDPFFPIKAVRETRDTLDARGFGLELDEIAGHDHDYYREAERFNKKAWTFLAPNALEEEPWFESYNFGPQ